MPWNIIVLIDHSAFEGRAAALSRVISGAGHARGLRIVERVYSPGRAIVWSGLEAAERYWTLTDPGLMTLLEPAA